MTTIATVHADGSYSYTDPRTGAKIQRATILPGYVRADMPPDEQARVDQLAADIWKARRHTVQGGRRTRCGLSEREAREMMRRSRKALRGAA